MNDRYGEIALHPAKALTVLREIQREPSPARVAYLRNYWDESQVMILFVARISEGKRKGKLHIYDGGSRWRAKVDRDPEYIFVCWVREMTEREAAAAFLSVNRESMKPGTFHVHRVGVRAGEPEALAIKRALDEANLIADASHSRYPNGSKGEFSAFGAASRIVRGSFDRTGNWHRASAAFYFTLKLGQMAYPMLDVAGRSERAHGYHADIIQAIDRIAMWNPDLPGDPDWETHLAMAVGSKLPGDWVADAVSFLKTMPGSSHRGTVVSKLIVTHNNQGRTPAKFKLAGGFERPA